MSIEITQIDYADPNCSTDVVHVVKLSDGREIEIWSGQACYDVYDGHTGKLVVGAKLVGTSQGIDNSKGDYDYEYTVYHFK